MDYELSATVLLSFSGKIFYFIAKLSIYSLYR